MAVSRSRKVAKEKEILEFLTDVMRSEESKSSESTKAAELIGKHYGMFSDKAASKEAVSVIIVDDIPDNEDTKISGTEGH